MTRDEAIELARDAVVKAACLASDMTIERGVGLKQAVQAMHAMDAAVAAYRALAAKRDERSKP